MNKNNQRPIGVLILLLPLALLMFSNCLSGLLYPVPGYAVPATPPAPLEQVPLRTGSGKLSAWAWIKESRPGAASKSPILLYFHGNGENLGTMLASGQIDDFVRRDLEFLALDYPGYGRSEGRPGEEAIRAAGTAALKYIRKNHPDRPALIVGWSLGAAAAMQTAAANPGQYAGLALFSPWATLLEVGALHVPTWMRFFVTDRYDSRAAARTVRTPVLIMHGALDSLIPANQGYELSQEFPDPGAVRFISLPGVGHNDLMGQPEVWRELERFIETLAK